MLIAAHAMLLAAPIFAPGRWTTLLQKQVLGQDAR